MISRIAAVVFGAFMIFGAYAHADSKSHVLTKLPSGNLLKVVGDFTHGQAHWELLDAFTKKTIESKKFDSPFLGRAKDLSVEVIPSFDPKLDIVSIDFSPAFQVVLYGDVTGMKVGPSIGPMSEMKTVLAQKFDFSRLKESQRITVVNHLKEGQVEAKGSFVWDGMKFVGPKAPQP